MEQLKELIMRSFPNESLVPQESSDSGVIDSLPNSFLELYKHVGPNKLTIPAYGNNFYIPSLDELNDIQWGYSFVGRAKAINPDWPYNWVVIAVQGADPFICDTETGQILYAQHGTGSWDADYAFESAEQMLWAIALTGEIISNAGNDFTNKNGDIKEQYVSAALKKLENQGFNNGTSILGVLGWR